MIFAQENGRQELYQRMWKMLGNPDHFSLAEALDVFEESYDRDQIEGTTGSLCFVLRSQGTVTRRRFEIALSRGLLVEGQLECAQVMAQLTLAGGVFSFFLPREMSLIDDYNVRDPEEFFQVLRQSRLFRWLGRATPLQSKLELKEYDIDHFFTWAKEMIPKLIEVGEWKCDGPSCPIGHESPAG